MFDEPDMTEPITSKSNPRLKELRKLHDRKHRERTGLFIAEGEDMLAAALNHGRVPETVFFDADGARALLGAAARRRGEGAGRRARRWRARARLGSGSRVIGVWRQPGSSSRPRAVAHRRLYLHDVADPGNVGTILRAAQAFGAGQVVLSPQTADPFGPKAVRASMGAIFGQPVVRATLDEARPRAGERRRSRWCPARARRCGS